MLTIPNIKTSVENKNILVLDKHAQNGTFDRDTRGRLISYAGGFSVVFPYHTTNGERWAFRCWHSDIGDSKKRYETISECIKNAQLDFLSEFEYINQGINVEGIVYPTIRMRWIDGITIKDYICQNRNSKKRLKALADNFLKMTQTLHGQSLAHGDLQHSNILVDKNHKLHLIDYDSFYCPKLKGAADMVTGLPDYQHPARQHNKNVSEKLDYFSELIIYISILAISENETLVDKYRIDDAERLLFSKEDFSDIRNSQIYKDIQILGKEFQDLLNVLEEYLKYSSIDKLLPFNDLILERKVSFSVFPKKIIRDKGTTSIKWDVPFDAEVFLKEENVKAQKCNNKGLIRKTPSENTTYELLITCKDGRKIKKTTSIGVFDECEIDFTADKYYVFPSIPVKLSWNVKNAKKVWLDTVEVSETGTKIVEPQKATTYTLSVKDEFGKKQKQIEVNMLPIPQVKTILVPTPRIDNKLSITIKQPKMNVKIAIPNIQIGTIKTEIPKVSSFKEMGLNVELSMPSSPKFSFKRAIDNIFNQIKRK